MECLKDDLLDEFISNYIDVIDIKEFKKDYELHYKNNINPLTPESYYERIWSNKDAERLKTILKDKSRCKDICERHRMNCNKCPIGISYYASQLDNPNCYIKTICAYKNKVILNEDILNEKVVIK